MPRSADDLRTLGVYAFSARGWQSALARELRVSRQSVVYWLSGTRAITERRSLQIAAIARGRHDARVRSPVLRLPARSARNSPSSLWICSSSAYRRACAAPT
jgi:hypothetical protein